MIATGLTFLFGFCLALLLALILSPIVWRRSRRMARREFEATIPTSANEIRASFDHVRAAAALQTRTREMAAAVAVEKAARERADAGRVARENADLRERNAALVSLLSEHKTAFEDVAETLEARETDFDAVEADLHETRHALALRSEELDALVAKFRVLTDRARSQGIETAVVPEEMEGARDTLADRKSRIEMQSTIKTLTFEVETLQTGLRQERGTVRERDATILDLLAGVAGVDGAGMKGAAMEPSRDEPELPGDVRQGAVARQAGDVQPSAGVHRDGDLATIAGSTPEPASIAEPALPPSSPSPSSNWGRSFEQAPSCDPAIAGLARAADVPHPGGNAQASEPAAQSIARRLRDALNLSPSPLGEDEADDDTLRDRIGDLAARVIDATARIEGPDSPIETMLAADRSNAKAPPGRLTLGGRVRRLRDRAEPAG